MKLFHIYLFCAIVIIGIIYYQTQHTCTLDRIFTSDNILSDAEYDMVVHETNKLHHQLVDESADNADVIRKKVEIDKDSLLYHIFHGQPFIDKLNTILGMKLESSPIRTLEYRTYDIGGQMDWHIDTRVTTKQCAQIEVVYTIQNTSDSTTVWRENDTNIEHAIITTPNSVLITQGESVFHKVTPVTYGKRSIIKASYEIIS
jgi:hypothetical protein